MGEFWAHLCLANFCICGRFVFNIFGSCFYIVICIYTGEEVSIDKQVACEECPRWLKMTEVA